MNSVSPDPAPSLMRTCGTYTFGDNNTPVFSAAATTPSSWIEPMEGNDGRNDKFSTVRLSLR